MIVWFFNAYWRISQTNASMFIKRSWPRESDTPKTEVSKPRPWMSASSSNHHRDLQTTETADQNKLTCYLNTIKQILRNLTLEKLPKKIFSDTFITIEVQVLSVRPISAWTQTLPKQFTSARTWNNICEIETSHKH